MVLGLRIGKNEVLGGLATPVAAFSCDLAQRGGSAGGGAEGIFDHFAYKVFIINGLTVILRITLVLADRPNEF
jgi:hypothetical protein